VAVIVLGAFGVLLGQLFLGTSVAAGGLALWRRTKPGARAPASRSLAAIAAVVACALASWGLAEAARDREATRQLAGLQQAIVQLSEIRGAPPARLEDLGWRLPPLFTDGRAGLTDPWGGAWRYRTPGASGDAYDLGSLGADGALGGGDDLGDPFAP
jgi:hypothetical protein